MLKRKWPTSADTPSFEEPKLESEFLTLAEMSSFIRRYWIDAAAAVVLGVLVAIGYVATTDPTYTARTRVLIEPKLPQFVQQTQPSDINLSLDTAQIESQIAVLQSEKIAKMVIDELELTDNKRFNQSTGRPIAERLSMLARQVVEAVGLGEHEWIKTAAAALSEETSGEQTSEHLTQFERQRRTVERFRSGLNVYRVGVSYAIEISFSSQDAALAAKVANATAEAFVREQLETRTAAAQEGRQWLENRIKQLRDQMNEATQAVQAFRVKHDYRVKSDAGQQGEGEGPTLEELQVTADTYRKMYESFLQAFTSSVNQQPYLVADARVITAATRPLAPSQPRSKLILAFGVVAGMTLGLGLAFTRHLLDRSVRSARQVREELGLECLGELPAVLGRRSGFGRLDEVMRAPDSTFSQGVKSVKAAIGITDLSKPIRLLGITSASPGEGKSTLAANLATLWSANGLRTLIIDADIHHATLTNNLLKEDAELAFRDSRRPVEQAKRQITTVPDQTYQLLPAPAVESLRLMTGKNTQALMSELGAYDMVVVDLPPMTSGTEWLGATAMLDGIAVVVQWGKTPSDLVVELTRSLHASKAAILGIVLTKVRGPSIRKLRRHARRAPR